MARLQKDLLFGCLLMAGFVCSLDAHAGSSQVVIDRPLHFNAPDGTATVVSPGRYHVKAAASAIELLSEESKARYSITAQSTKHAETVEGPEALLVISDDLVHLVLLLPEARALDAIGSLSGVSSRATSLQAPMTQLQIQQAYTSDSRTNLPAPTVSGTAAPAYALETDRQLLVRITDTVLALAQQMTSLGQQVKQLQDQLVSLRQTADAIKAEAQIPPGWYRKYPLAQRWQILGSGPATAQAVLDKETGLVWERSAALTRQTYDQADKYCKGLSKGGFIGGWRIPTTSELTTLTGFISMPTSTTNPFTAAGDLWTASDGWKVYHNPVSPPNWAHEAVSIFSTSSINVRSYEGQSTIGVLCVRGGATIYPMQDWQEPSLEPVRN